MSSATQASAPEDLVRRPGSTDHYMILSEYDGSVVVRAGATEVARSDRAILVQEVFKGSVTLRYYLPREDVSASLNKAERRTHCPLKGDASYFDLMLGSLEIPDAAWSYESVLDFDSRLRLLLGMVSFDDRYTKTELRS